MATAKDEPKLVELTEAARRIGRGYYETRDLVLKGQLEGRKRGGRWWIVADSLPPTGERAGA